MTGSGALDSARWANYSGPLRAILDEYQRALRELEPIVLQISPAQFGQGGPLADKDYPDYGSIMVHVVACIHVYVDYIEDGLDTEDRGRRKHDYDCSTPASSIQSMWMAFDRTATMLSRIKHYSEEDMEKVRFPTRWSQGFDIEQMLEHAIVHILRHRRQIERWQKAASG